MSPAVSVSEPVGSDGILDCRIAGPLVRIEALPPGVRARMADLFRPFVVAQHAHEIAEPVARFRVIRRGTGDWIARQVDVNGHPVGTEVRRMQAGGRIGNLLAMLEWRSMDAALAATDQYAVVHAAALRRGVDTVFLLGRSGVGKTTLTLGLMGRGWEQFSDDVALVDTQSLEVHSFPRCFHVSAATLAALPVCPPLERVGGLAGYLVPMKWADGAGRPSAIVAVDRNPKLPTMMHPLSQAEAAGALLEATIRNQLPGSERARIAVRLAAEARGCRALNNMSLTTSLDLIEEAVAS